MGAALGMAIGNAFTNEYPQTIHTISAPGIIGDVTGLEVGNRKTINENISFNDAIIMLLEEFSGYLLGVGISYLLTPNEVDNPSKSILVSGTLGGLIGLGLMKAILINDNQGKKMSSLFFKLNPAGLAGMVYPELAQNISNPMLIPPSAVLRYKF